MVISLLYLKIPKLHLHCTHFNIYSFSLSNLSVFQVCKVGWKKQNSRAVAEMRDMGVLLNWIFKTAKPVCWKELRWGQSWFQPKRLYQLEQSELNPSANICLFVPHHRKRSKSVLCQFSAFPTNLDSLGHNQTRCPQVKALRSWQLMEKKKHAGFWKNNEGLCFC